MVSYEFEKLEVFFGFFSFIGLAFLLMNIFNTTFPSISINAGQDKSSVRGFTKETFRSDLDKDNLNKAIVLFNKTNAMYFVYFLINAIALYIITKLMY